MNNTLVTGGAGFIGSHLVEELVKRRDNVRVLDNFSTGKIENLHTVADSIQIMRGDIRNVSDVSKALDGIDTVYHQAAFVSVPLSFENPQVCFDINVLGTINLLKAGVSSGVRKFILASSAAVYGDQDNFPYKENLPVELLSPYAASKHFNEKLAIVYSQFFAVTVTALRYFNVYGERQSPDSHYAAVIPKFLQQFETELPATVFGDGRQTRDFVHVSDVVAANLMASETEDQIPSVLNVCSGREVSLLDILDILRKIFPKSKEPKFHPARPGDVPRSVGDPNLAKKLLGFEANVDLTTGLAESVTA